MADELQGKLYVLGHPVAHSKSPDMHNAAYRALGLPWEYGFADKPSEEDARAFLERREWLALNVTMPYKPLAFGAATWRSESALLAEGANVLVSRGDDVLADNTDGKGCIAYLTREGVEFRGARVAVCGTGPTSRAFLHAAVRAGAKSVALLGRDGTRAQEALASYREKAAAESIPLSSAGGDGAGAELIAGSYADHAGTLAGADVVLDATPLGMKPGDPAAFDTDVLSAGQVVFDAVYGHGTTALIGAARLRGCRAFDGAGMLVAQAAETVRDLVEWLEVPVDLETIDLFSVMAEAAGFLV